MIEWPIREGLLRYVWMLRERARIDYWNSVLAWAPQAPYMKGDAKPPKMPKILRAE